MEHLLSPRRLPGALGNRRRPTGASERHPCSPILRRWQGGHRITMARLSSDLVAPPRREMPIPGRRGGWVAACWPQLRYRVPFFDGEMHAPLQPYRYPGTRNGHVPVSRSGAVRKWRHPSPPPQAGTLLCPRGVWCQTRKASLSTAPTRPRRGPSALRLPRAARRRVI